MWYVKSGGGLSVSPKKYRFRTEHEWQNKKYEISSQKFRLYF